MSITTLSVTIQPQLPERIQRLRELSENLLYSWDRDVNDLFYRLDHKLWRRCQNNPKLFLQRISQQRLDEAARDRIFLQEYERVVSSVDTYMEEGSSQFQHRELDPEEDLIAYFCAEYGLHESLPIYSGGLGILAGDHFKTAMDLSLPFVAVGLFYGHGYFNQRIGANGEQISSSHDNIREELPISAVTDGQGELLKVSIAINEHDVQARIWSVEVGHLTLYLLDTDVEENRPEDRTITSTLYGGDRAVRIRQEAVLGIGGVRALRALGRTPTVWHINEGHAAFLTLERMREMREQGHSFETALEITASSTVFTTHTPVPAGHDIFPRPLMMETLGHYIDSIAPSAEQVLALGNHPGGTDEFNMTALALRCSRFHNGVSAIHGGVASQMESYIWPQIPPHENPIHHVTNGVHVPTFLARPWSNLFDMKFGGGWRNQLCSASYWEQIETVPDHTFWSIRQTLKEQLFEEIIDRLRRQYSRNGMGHMQMLRRLRLLMDRNNQPLVIGFARRFATYKRATLLFRDRERLARIIGDPQRPVLFLFAGKAHPSDDPGQGLIREIHQISNEPEFEGKVLMIEGFNLSLSRHLVTGVDVWLNNPEYPLEASGTSGQKAAINGVLNLSVGDGWWAEAYHKQDNLANGWMINPHEPGFDPHRRDCDEAQELMDIIEKSVIPKYFNRDSSGIPKVWVRMSKKSIRTIMPRFNSARMVIDYLKGYYAPASSHGHNLLINGGQLGRELSEWKMHIREKWPGVALSLIQRPASTLSTDAPFTLVVAANLNGLSPSDVTVECIFESGIEAGTFAGEEGATTITLHPQGETEGTIQHFSHSSHLPLSGLQNYRIRIYPSHPGLAHRFECGQMSWLSE
jgi:starch phosphorylase